MPTTKAQAASKNINFWGWQEGVNSIEAANKVLRKWEEEFGISKNTFKLVINKEQPKLHILCTCCKVCH